MNKILLKIGYFFRFLSRRIFILTKGVCWRCGYDCGFNSCIADGKMWCNNCWEISGRYDAYRRIK